MPGRSRPSIALAAALGIAAALATPPACHAAPRAGDMVDIAAGTFRMGDLAGDGDAGERPVHDVRLRAFRLGRTEVTRGQFARFVAATGYRTEAERDVVAPGCWVYDVAKGEGGDYLAGSSWRAPGFAQDDSHPVVCVSWNDAQSYLRWLGRVTHRRLRLPSNAEWEYAARAGTSTRYPWGDAADAGCAFANGVDRTPFPDGSARVREQRMECSDGWFFTAPVASFRPNAWGLHDMIGNAWEWTQDCFSDDYHQAPRDGRADTSGDCGRRIDRGGSWFNHPAWLRVSNRDRDEPTNRFSHLGFRIAEDAVRPAR